jgi:hypothetical protein
MAPTIGRQWRGGAEDYAALCDYCDVRYLRSQLQRQSNGRLACLGPGTNGCGAGLDEVALDKLNADKMRDRRRPTAPQGGRFDRVRASMEDIFGAALVEYWDAGKGVVSSTNGSLTAWTGQKLGAVFTADPVDGLALWHASRSEFYGRPGVEISGGPSVGAVWVATGAFLPSAARSYVAVARFHSLDVFSGPNGLVELSGSGAVATFARSAGDRLEQLVYHSAAVPSGTILEIPTDAVGSHRQAHLFEMDARGPLSFRVGAAMVTTSVDSPTAQPVLQVSLSRGSTIALLAIANDPTDEQVQAFRSLATSYAAVRP